MEKKYNKSDILDFLKYAFNEDEGFFISLEETLNHWIDNN